MHIGSMARYSLHATPRLGHWPQKSPAKRKKPDPAGPPDPWPQDRLLLAAAALEATLHARVFRVVPKLSSGSFRGLLWLGALIEELGLRSAECRSEAAWRPP